MNPAADSAQYLPNYSTLPTRIDPRLMDLLPKFQLIGWPFGQRGPTPGATVSPQVGKQVGPDQDRITKASWQPLAISVYPKQAPVTCSALLPLFNTLLILM